MVVGWALVLGRGYKAQCDARSSDRRRRPRSERTSARIGLAMEIRDVVLVHFHPAMFERCPEPRAICVRMRGQSVVQNASRPHRDGD